MFVNKEGFCSSSVITMTLLNNHLGSARMELTGKVSCFEIANKMYYMMSSAVKLEAFSKQTEQGVKGIGPMKCLTLTGSFGGSRKSFRHRNTV